MSAPAAAVEGIVERVREDLAADPGPVDVARVSRALRSEGRVLGAAAMLEVTARVRDHVAGLGPLQGLLGADVTDVLVNGDGTIWVDDPEGLHRSEVRIDPREARELAVRLATLGGRRLDDAAPCADARLPGGIRFHGVLPPLSTGGALISLRLPARRALSLADLEAAGALPGPAPAILRALVTARAAFVVTGGTGSGKTTLLGALLSLTDAQERIVVIEDAQELRIDHPHVVHLQSRHANSEGSGGVGLIDLVRQSLRMRPDRVVLGECRGGEVRELLQALNTGHEGGCGTLHANTALDVPARLEALGALGGLDRQALAAQAASALEVIVHLGRPGGRRRVVEVAVLERGADGGLRAVSALDLRDEEPAAGPGWERLAVRLHLDPGILEGAVGGPARARGRHAAGAGAR
ncbi:secretion system protein E [Brachybacterium endophyticum]|uniref:Secretion system protein E n=1 Tax=Brachybacterium endophyticum TaxID=2182385 RepID=A0A2U2RL59_9MICO|nr:TadA family conjugal transfer-associated ATPase [Brachybacterium endophyticum]PWH06514.1 secretion system protein E [Brachybacterium endophyticum]